MTAQSFMDLALEQAQIAETSGEVPIGCVIVRDGKVLAQAGNRTLTDKDPTAHAEVLAIREAARVLGSERLVDCDLYVTLEPCTMCAAAISFARIRRLYYGADRSERRRGRQRSAIFRFAHLPSCPGDLSLGRRERGRRAVEELLQGAALKLNPKKI